MRMLLACKVVALLEFHKDLGVLVGCVGFCRTLNPEP